MINCFTWLLLAKLALSFSSDFSIKGDPCSKFDSCYSKSVLKTCSCDSDCRVYGTCCHDMNKPTIDVSDYQCYDSRTVRPVYVKKSCSENYLGNVANKLACLEDEEDEMDVRNNLLITSRTTKITYWNKHCAACNNEASADFEFWNVEVFCPPHKDVSRSLIRTNFTFDQEKRQWGIMIDDEFLNCALRYSPPLYVNEVKHCTPNMIASCPANYTDQSISTKCSQYYAERKVKNSNLFFKNIHCAICNGANVKLLECPGMSSPEDNAEESDFRDMIEEIFTNGEWLEKEAGNRFECSTGFIYDPAREKCRRFEFKEVAATVQNSAPNCRIESLIMMIVLFTLLL